MQRECIAGQTYTIRIGLRDEANPNLALANPTLHADDFSISINGGTWDLLDNMPTVTPASSEVVVVVLSVAETTAAGANGSIVVRVADANNDSGWIGGLLEIHVRAAAISELTQTQSQTAATAALTAYAPATATALATVAGYVDTEVAAIKAKTDNLPSDPADASDIAASLTTITGYIDTEVATILAAVDTEIAAIKAVTDSLPDGGALTTLLANVAAILADTGSDGVAIASATINGIADAVLGRSVANVEDTASIYSITGLILAQFESSAPGTTWTIYKTNGSTTFATRTLTEDATAKPVTGVS